MGGLQVALQVCKHPAAIAGHLSRYYHSLKTMFGERTGMEIHIKLTLYKYDFDSSKAKS